MTPLDDLIKKLSAEDLEAAQGEAAKRYTEARQEVKALNEAIALKRQ